MHPGRAGRGVRPRGHCAARPEHAALRRACPGAALRCSCSARTWRAPLSMAQQAVERAQQAAAELGACEVDSAEHLPFTVIPKDLDAGPQVGTAACRSAACAALPGPHPRSRAGGRRHLADTPGRQGVAGHTAPGQAAGDAAGRAPAPACPRRLDGCAGPASGHRGAGPAKPDAQAGPRLARRWGVLCCRRLLSCRPSAAEAPRCRGAPCGSSSPRGMGRRAGLSEASSGARGQSASWSCTPRK